jgi:hypothetical protein
MTSHRPARDAAMPLDLAKHDRTVALGGRTFAVRAYPDRRAPNGPGWHAVIVENRTPIDHDVAPTDSAEQCLAAAERFLSAKVAAGAAEHRWAGPGRAAERG